MVDLAQDKPCCL